MRKRTAVLTSAAMGLLPLIGTGCARPNEIGYTPAYTTNERFQQIARNWDLEGKQTQDDIDHALLLRPLGQLTIWHAEGGGGGW